MLYGHSQLPATDPAPLDPLAGDRMSDDHFAAWLKETSQNEEVSSWTTPLSRRKAGAEHGKSAAPATAQAPSTPPARFPSLSSGDLPTAPAKKQKRMSSPESVKAQASNTPPAKKTAAAKTATPTSKSGRTSSKTSLPTPAPTPATRSRKSSNARSPSLSPTPPERAAASEQQAKGKKRAYVVVSSDSEDVPSSSAGGSRSSDKGRPVALSGFLQGMKRGQSNQRDAENESTRKSKGKRRAIVVSSDSDEEGLPSSSTGQSLASRTQEEVAKSTNWANMTKAERAERTARISQGRLAMAPEKKQARKDKLVTAWNAKTAEEKTEHSEKISRGQASMSADALAKREEARRRTREQKDPEERKRMHTVIGQASAATWASRGDEEKESIAVLYLPGLKLQRLWKLRTSQALSTGGNTAAKQTWRSPFQKEPSCVDLTVG
ncbi:hypothetical protein BDZ88DRAFT_187236 [Geranomyces variabilis]|nr:hypothetical protein BDZ88DRAFT_187236 [Geranomyces variabilis]KAJ3135507.1 hypothetical protein HDU90_003910 [Geranomyces variabilis]